ncbi:MAG: hypothetical protein AB7V50_09665, partial [Vampirovibrionia bacterium]
TLQSSNSTETIKFTSKNNKLYAKYKIKSDFQPGEYTFKFSYKDSKGKQKEIEAIGYVIGKIELANNSLNFGKLNNKGSSSKAITVNSELKLTTLPLKIEIKSVNFNTEDFKNADLLFNYQSNFLIKGSEYTENMTLNVPEGIFKSLQNPILSKKYDGTITIIVYSKENEVLSEKKLPISFTIGSFVEYNITLMIGFMLVISSIIGSIIIYKKKKKSNN